MKRSPRAKTVDAYIARTPPAARALLVKMRQIIKAVAPDAEEMISYQIPMYKQHGPLVGFGAFKGHCSLFVCSTSLLSEFTNELTGYTGTKSAVHFPIGKPLPVTLVKKLVKARFIENEGRARGKVNSARTRSAQSGRIVKRNPAR